MRFEHFVDLVGNCVPVADVLEVGRIEVHCNNLSPLPFCLGSDQSPADFTPKLIGWQMRSDEFSDGLDLSVLRADMKMS